MQKAYDVMTRPLATCAPETSVTDVATTMRDRDIGDVLIVEEGRLRGIVTDRDLALQALTGQDDPRQTPIHKYMSTKVITGESTWSLEQVAKIMAEHQIRRLPIIQDGQVVGIVSLGDVARQAARQDVIAKSLRAISAPIGIAAPHRSVRGGPWIGLALAAVVTGVMAWLTWNRSGQAVRKQMVKSDLYHTAQHTLTAARDKVDEAASSKSVRNARRNVDAKINDVRRDVDARLNDLVAQLPTLEYKPAKSKHGLFA
jgi:CBS domain-containing protein